jgi:hypothetical protein
MSVKLPSRYEDLDPEFRSKLRPVPELNHLVAEAYARMKVSGGVRFLPIYGKSGSGKTCAACELSTHIPSSHLGLLTPEDIALRREALVGKLRQEINLFNQRDRDLFIWVVDQYEEKVHSRADIPTEFIEKLSLLDRGGLRDQPMLFIWLTTDKEFQLSLSHATSRNERILLRPEYELVGLPHSEWPQVIEETFSFHNRGRELADFNILRADLDDICQREATIGKAIEEIGLSIGGSDYPLQDLSEYQVIMLWPVVDGIGIERVKNFANPIEGYTLNWSNWYNSLNTEDRKQLPLKEYNQARLYFDFRVVPIPVADLHCICAKLDDANFIPGKSYRSQFGTTHYYTVLSGSRDERKFGTLFARESKRAEQAKQWYKGVTNKSVPVGKRLALCLTEMGHLSKHEQEVRTKHAHVTADVLSAREGVHQSKAITELKVFSPQNMTPSQIRDEIRATLRKYAQLAGYLPRQ